ncbi:hypothetical protein [Candidatus Ulvibacter alkanivorans]|uniref:hypothetical protein n=1 Tax=Candidatus Ulvibacter alkanivorans TaxID=2267620 RepID=UPI00109C8D42|nr:hypothetical protein [Candidatus Ulvibacter alkanivorans]
MNRSIYILLFFFFSTVSVMASEKDSLTVRLDSTRIETKEFSEALSEKYSGSDYDYDQMDGEAQNFIARGLGWFFQQLADMLGIQMSYEMQKFLEFLFYALLGILILYIILKLLIGENATAFFTRKSTMVAPLNIEEEHIENIDLDTYISDALAQQNYRLAIRYMYLRSLKLLSAHSLIDWHYDKTNTDYYREIDNEQVKANFKKVSYLYDNIWYGEYDLNNIGFQSAKVDFDQLTKTVSHAR